MSMQTVTREDARAAKKKLTARYGGDRRVTSIGLGRSAPDCHLVRVTVLSDADRAVVPLELDGVPVEVSVSGPVLPA
jgi:hypothetical protein